MLVLGISDFLLKPAYFGYKNDSLKNLGGLLCVLVAGDGEGILPWKSGSSEEEFLVITGKG